MPWFRADQETATSANGEEHKELEETGEEAEEYSERVNQKFYLFNIDDLVPA